MSDNDITSAEYAKKLSDLSDKIKQISNNISNLTNQINDMKGKIYVSEISKKMITIMCGLFFFGFILFSLLFNKGIGLASFFQVLSFLSMLISSPYISSRLLKKKYSSKIVDLTKIVNEDLNLEQQLRKEYFQIEIKARIKTKTTESISTELIETSKEYNLKPKKLILEKK